MLTFIRSPYHCMHCSWSDRRFILFFPIPHNALRLGGQASQDGGRNQISRITFVLFRCQKNKKELRKIYKILELPSEKLGKNALINIVCNSLKIPTSCSKPNARDSNADILFTSDVEVPAYLKITPAYLQHVKGWVKSLQGFPSQLDTRAVGNYLLGEGFTQDQWDKYKTNRAWDHKRGVHSVR